MVVVPLVFTTVVLGIAGLGDMHRLGRIGVKTLLLFFATTIVAATAGLTMANWIEAGAAITELMRVDLLASFSSQTTSTLEAASQGITVDTLVNIVPRNPVEAAANGDLIAFILFTIVFGIALSRVPPERSKPVRDFLTGVGEAVTVIIGYAMRFAPIGVAGLAFAVTARLGLDVLRPLGLYTGLVIFGLAVHQFGVVGPIIKAFVDLSPRRFFAAIRLPMITAFSTASSSATLPTTVRAAEDKLGISETVAGFVLPLGATLHMNGTAMFGAITVVFLAQAFGLGLTLSSQILIVFLMVLSAVSAAGIPSGSIPLIVVILESVGIPGEAIALIFGVEPILGMARTSTNVTGDLAICAVIAQNEALEDESQ